MPRTSLNTSSAFSSRAEYPNRAGTSFPICSFFASEEHYAMSHAWRSIFRASPREQVVSRDLFTVSMEAGDLFDPKCMCDEWALRSLRPRLRHQDGCWARLRSAWS